MANTAEGDLHQHLAELEGRNSDLFDLQRLAELDQQSRLRPHETPFVRATSRAPSRNAIFSAICPAERPKYSWAYSVSPATCMKRSSVPKRSRRARGGSIWSAIHSAIAAPKPPI